MIIIFIINYLIIIIHVRKYIYFYEIFFEIYQKLLVSYFFKYSFNTITILELVNYFSRRSIKSHISNLMNFQNLPEVFQHARTVAKNPKKYYHISDKYQGYDAFSFNKNDLQKLIIEKDMSLMEIHEKKSVMAHASKYLKIDAKIPSLHKKYSFSNMEGLGKSNYGARPGPVDQLEIKTYSTENYNIFKNLDLSGYKKPSIIIEDYSDIYAKVVAHPKHGGLGEGTLINDSAFEHLKWFYNYLENNSEMCIYLNNLLEENKFFPL